MKQKSFKNFVYNLIGSTTNACLSLFLLIFITRINGIEYAGIFSFCFSTACVFQVIATYSGRTYQVTERDKNITDTDYVYTKIICCFAMIIVTVIFMFLKQYNFEKNVILILLMIYKMLESFEDVFYAIMQKNDDLYKVGISLFLRGIGAIILFLVIDIITHNIFLCLVILVLYSILQIIFYDIKNIKVYNFKLSKFNLNNTKKIIILGFCTFILTFFIQYMMNASKYSIDNYLSDNFQTIFGIIVMPATVIVLCGQLIIHPFLTKLTVYLKEKKMNDFNKIILKLSLSIIAFGIIADILAYLIGIPILELIYGIKLKKYVIDLVIIISGATLFGVTFILSNALITLRDTFSQVIMFSISSVFTYFLSNYMVLKFGIHGAVYSYIISMGFLLILFVMYYLFKKKNY